MKRILEEYGLGFVFAVFGVSFSAAIIAFTDQITAL